MCDLPSKKLRQARKKAGYSAPDFAKRVGQKYSTYVHHENGTRPIRAEIAKKYAAALQHVGLKATDLLAIDEDIGAPATVWVTGDVAMGVWRELALDEEQSRNRKQLNLPASRKPESRRALLVLDESVNKQIGAGEYAIYLPLPEDPGPLEQYVGKLVYVEAVVNKLAERSIRFVILHKDGRLKLSAYSTNPKFSGFIMYPCHNNKVTLLGRIIGRYEDLDDDFSTKK